MQRFNHEFQKASGSREMVEHEEGEWVRYEDVQEHIEALERALKSCAAVISAELKERAKFQQVAEAAVHEADAVLAL